MQSPAYRRLIHLFGRVYCTPFDENDALLIAEHELASKKFVLIPSTCDPIKIPQLDSNFHSSLTEIFNFDEMVDRTSRRKNAVKIIICLGRTPASQIQTAFLVGCHMLLSQGKTPDEICEVFSRTRQINALLSFSDGDCYSFLNHFKAIQRSRTLNWIDSNKAFNSEDTDLFSLARDEYIHYASPINGQLYTVIPGRIFYFDEPFNTNSRRDSDNSTWFDVGGQRRFTADFYADLLAYMGVSLVVRLHASDHADPAYERHGLTVCSAQELGLFQASNDCLGDVDSASSGSWFSLQVMDRFLHVCREAGGAVAISGGGGGGEGVVGTLVCALMLRQGLFTEAAEAVCWVSLATGKAPPAAAIKAIDGALGRTTGPAGLACRRAHSLSMD